MGWSIALLERRNVMSLWFSIMRYIDHGSSAYESDDLSRVPETVFLPRELSTVPCPSPIEK